MQVSFNTMKMTESPAQLVVKYGKLQPNGTVDLSLWLCNADGVELACMGEFNLAAGMEWVVQVDLLEVAFKVSQMP